jgi:hypothetical protein
VGDTVTRWTVTLLNKGGHLAWRGDFEDEEDAKAALENAKIATKEIGGKSRAVMDPEPTEEPKR